MSVSVPNPAMEDLDGGTQLFHDVFRRADKNDDGKLSMSEFWDYFEDDLLAPADLDAIFKAIDADHTGFLSLEELRNSFQEDFQPFAKLFSHLTSIHQTLGSTLHHLAQADKYPKQDFYQQFKTRWFLREFITQMGSFRMPVDAAIESMQLQSSRLHNRPVVQESLSAEETRKGSKGQRSMESPRGLSGEVSELHKQIDRLCGVIGKLEKSSIQMDMPEEGSFDSTQQEAPFFVAQRKMKVAPTSVEPFQKMLKKYLKSTRNQEGCFHVYVQQRKDTDEYLVYEVWRKESFYEEHFTSTYKEFAKLNIDMLARPEELSTMELPAIWWPRRA